MKKIKLSQPEQAMAQKVMQAINGLRHSILSSRGIPQEDFDKWDYAIDDEETVLRLKEEADGSPDG